MARCRFRDTQRHGTHIAQIQAKRHHKAPKEHSGHRRIGRATWLSGPVGPERKSLRRVNETGVIFGAGTAEAPAVEYYYPNYLRRTRTLQAVEYR